MRRCYKCGAKLNTNYIVCPECERKLKVRKKMTRSNAIEELKAIKSAYSDKEFHEARLMKSEEEALDMGVKAIDLIMHLKDRPCDACEFHKEKGCSKWDCVFDELVYWEHRG